MPHKIAAVAVATAVVATLTAPATAAADPVNQNTVEVTLDCGAEGVFTGTSVFQSSALPFAIAGATTQAISKAISYVDETGATVVVRDQPGTEHQDLVTCTYRYPGFPFLVTGRFLFTGPR
jgi:hypothetical protein